ncbi:hypothetical protein MBCUT_12210 [Methanobrevibacter cuticularis]|uniref:DUF1284 domain-containing protein n=1 Tax=Methanobrevibacter cuticularis TaxID=47311 RepID=A0A166DS52_9EURY|nr:DUF1284 domain-containing protein [Methanobrevibacter cuticularis]KZX15895.1 hypothetical protein MBCUT_12210 [Methanobrevibacter cuticularis]
MKANPKIISSIITLRAHHLICLQGYRGYGYDKNFKENLEKILNKLKEENVEVIITDSNDDICEYCPNLKKNLCHLGISSENSSYLHDPCDKEIEKSNEKIVKMDLAILKKTKIEKKKKYNVFDLFNIVNNKFMNIEDLKDICINCSWMEKCLWYKSRKR